MNTGDGKQDDKDKEWKVVSLINFRTIMPEFDEETPDRPTTDRNFNIMMTEQAD